MQKMTIRECEKPRRPSIRLPRDRPAHDGRLVLAGGMVSRESRYDTACPRNAHVHTHTRARTRACAKPWHTRTHERTNGDTENGRSGIEARLIVLDNSDASADATIPGRCWPGLADWLAGSRGYISLSLPLSLLSSPPLSLSLPPSALLSSPLSLSLSFFLAPFLSLPLPPRRYHPSSFCRPSLSSCNPFLSSRVSTSSPRPSVTVAPLVVPFVFTLSLCLSTGSFLEMMRRFRLFFFISLHIVLALPSLLLFRDCLAYPPLAFRTWSLSFSGSVHVAVFRISSRRHFESRGINPTAPMTGEVSRSRAKSSPPKVGAFDPEDDVLLEDTVLIR